MKKTIIAVLLLTIVPAAMALNTSDLLATIAMPLAVAAVSDVPHVGDEPLATLVSAFNQANVPPAQFVQVIRYVPVALVDQNGQPFIAYVQQEVSQGTTGDAFVNAIVQRLQSSYGVTPQLVTTEVAPVFVTSGNYIPTEVVTRLDTQNYDPLAAIALPLAVAAVSNIAGIPQDQLASLVASLNQANVPVVQEVQMIRYVPVALVDNNGQPFVQFVQQQVSQGVTGPALVPIVTQQLQTYYPAAQVTVSAPPRQTIVVDENFVPRPVALRVEEVRRNPHGGPPGQIKKELGLQTGAEVVHGEREGRNAERRQQVQVPVAQPTPMASSAPEQREKEKGHGRGHQQQQQQVVAAPPPAAPVAVAAPNGKGPQGGPPGQQKEKGGKGKDKGHGKD